MPLGEHPVSGCMKIAYVTSHHPGDRRAWSGTTYRMWMALQAQGAEIQFVGPLLDVWRLPLRIKQQVHKTVFGQHHQWVLEPARLKGYARQVEHAVRSSGADVIFSSSSLVLSYVEARQPLAFWTDASYAEFVRYYPTPQPPSAASMRNGNRAEQSALSRAALGIYSSEWARRSTLEHYQVDAARMHVVPFGAGFEKLYSPEAVARAIAERPSDVCRLLFLGVDWKRKGGAIAVDAQRALAARGLRSELTIAGCHPPDGAELPDGTTVIPFIDKTTPHGEQVLMELLARSHFLILPSRADATPIVFCEANALGVPCLATDTGGIPGVIRPGVNGALFPVSDGGPEYADYIAEAFANSRGYRQLAESSLEESRRRLNWDTSGRRVLELLQSIENSAGRAALHQQMTSTPAGPKESTYSPIFYSGIARGSACSARSVVPLLVGLLNPGSVVDVGCGTGIWLAEFGRCGVTDGLGIDGAYVRRDHLVVDAARFAAHELNRPLRLDRKFDLAISLEVAEHLPPERADSFVGDLTQLSPVIVFSAAVPFQGGTHHLNEQWPEYWAEKFARRHYVAVDWLRPKIWKDPTVEPWYRQNTILYVQQDVLRSRLDLAGLAAHVADGRTLSRVHPEMYERAARNHTQLGLRALLKALGGSLARAVGGRLGV